MNVTIPCVCGHHETDTITLRERLDFRQSLACRQALKTLYVNEPNPTPSEIFATLSELYLYIGIAAWTLEAETEKGVKPLPVSHAAITEKLIPDYEAAMLVADAADDLYSEAVLLPLLARGRRYSRTTPTDDLTSPPTVSSPKLPKRSKRSSISTIPTAAIEVTSPSLDGDSSFLPKSVSAA